MTVRGFWALFMAHMIAYKRSRTAMYWSLAFPLFFLFIFQFAFARGNADVASALMPGLFTITIISGSFFGVAIRMVTERENGILRRHRVAPVSALEVVLAHGATGLVTLLASLAAQFVVAKLVFHIHVAGSPIALALVLAMGALALIPIGLIVGSVARDSRAAPAITNFLFFPMMFLSGSAIPFQFLPEWMQRLARAIPTTYIVEALNGVIVRGVGLSALWGPLGVLALTAVIGIGSNGLLFRWESDEPVRRERVLAAVGILVAIYAGAYLFAPALEMTKVTGS